MYPYSPYGYQPYTVQMPQNQMQMQQQQMQPMYQQNSQQSSDERLWVQGEEAAKAYLVAPNGFVRLWDSLNPVFYEKRTDATGRPYMETFTYEKRSETPPFANNQTKSVEDYGEKFKALERRISALEEKEKHEPNADDPTVSTV